MMLKRAITFVFLATGVAVLGGCPIYSDDRDNRVCQNDTDGINRCYDCPDPYYSSSCFGWTCNANSDCPSGYYCTSDHQCALGDVTNPTPPSGGNLCTKPSDCPSGSSCGADNKCHAGDCSTSGCPSQFVCKISGGLAQCVAIGGGGDGGVTSQCSSDTDCPTPAGSKCLSGQCVAPADQCADQTQCPSGDQCVQGACTPSCNGGTPCPTGFSCNPDQHVCTGNPTPCTTSASCSGGDVCVEQHCVAPCGAGFTCPSGEVCIDGGCIPDQKPQFTCTTDGAMDACQAGSICLRHSCYIACDADAGADACKAADKFNVCKTVTTSSGDHTVCGSDTNLGTDCDPTVGKNCADPLVCIDGYCR
ncbi:MAG TPA: hypothetical protein VIF62_21635 [Labilithrix sp.]|jgi:hypothetical protein